MEDLILKLREFANERDWDQFHSPKNLSMALSVEVSENLVQELILKKQFEWALLISKKLKSIKPEYNFREIFGDYEEEIIKMGLVSAN